MSARTPKDDPWLTPEELADRFKLDVKIIDRWRREAGKGPAWVKLGKAVRYRLSAVEAFERQAEQDAERRRAS